ncbi:hypothetical protein LT350_14345 [Mycolicibacterium smegmatis]|uniref:hypothetical protein n=1 Tax=Mycolicibacterium smegmatis TaxID=1772 RepID=UPI001E36ED0E|nr:hypothetical protein [Mycolicibacterium smegmatis]UGU34005.1 hypothetical protein LT350_14345 [Mycolicibacterium smegmatis]
MTDQPMSFHDGDVVVTAVYTQDAYVYVTRSDYLESGLTLWTVYRSTWIEDDNHPLYRPVLELLDGTVPFGEPQIDEHEMWMGGEAVVTTYLARKEKQGV